MITVKATVVPEPRKIVEPKPPHVKPPKRIWDNYIVVGEIQKSSSIKFVVAAAVRDGVRYINIREFYIRKTDGVWKPGRDGITIPMVTPIDKGTKLLHVYTGFEKLLQVTVETLATIDLFNAANAVYAKENNNEDK